MNLYEWAKKEVEIVKEEVQKASDTKAECDYGCSCYDSALKAFKSLCEDGHSGMSIVFTQQILNRLIDGKALTSIEDTPDVWELAFDNVYQCKRMSSLFKHVLPDGSIEYRDNNRVVCVDTESNTIWHNGMASDLVAEKYPITMPYIPENNPYKVHINSFYYLQPNAVGEYDHIAYLYVVKPDGTEEYIDRYYAETPGGFEEIPRKLYYARKLETIRMVDE